MKKLALLLAGVMLMMATGNANALTMWLSDGTNGTSGYYAFDNNLLNPDNVFLPSGWVQKMDSNNTLGSLVFTGSFNGFDFTVNSAFSKPNIGTTTTSSLNLGSTEVSFTNSGPGNKSLEVWLTDTNYTLPINGTLNPNVTTRSSLSVLTAGKVDYQSYIDPSNTGAKWGYYGGQLLTSGTIEASTHGTAESFAINSNPIPSFLTGPFALTEGITITHFGANETTTVGWQLDTTPVPEPGTMVLLGFGMLGLAIYGKRRMNKEA